MRAIVDKYFADTWVVAFYMGFSVIAFVASDTSRTACLYLTRPSNAHAL